MALSGSGVVIAVLGFVLVKKQSVRVATVLIRLTVGFIVCFTTGMVFVFCLAFLFITMVLDGMKRELKLVANDAVSDRTSALTILGVICGLGIVCGTLSCLGCIKSYNAYKQSINNYREFLLSYQETPRSKMVKKYKPLMDPLMEASRASERTWSYLSAMNTQH